MEVAVQPMSQLPPILSNQALSSETSGYNGNGTLPYGQASQGRSAAGTSYYEAPVRANGRRRVVTCSVGEAMEEAQVFYDVVNRENDPYRSTVCMDAHVQARLEEDIKRSAKRQANPDTAMPDRGPMFEMEIRALLDERSGSSYPRSGRRSVTGSPSTVSPSYQRNARGRSPSRGGGTEVEHLPALSPSRAGNRSGRSGAGSGASPSHASSPQRSVTAMSGYGGYSVTSAERVYHSRATSRQSSASRAESRGSRYATRSNGSSYAGAREPSSARGKKKRSQRSAAASGRTSQRRGDSYANSMIGQEEEDTETFLQRERQRSANRRQQQRSYTGSDGTGMSLISEDPAHRRLLFDDDGESYAFDSISAE